MAKAVDDVELIMVPLSFDGKMDDGTPQLGSKYSQFSTYQIHDLRELLEVVGNYCI
jgi:hypothetical protein